MTRVCCINDCLSGSAHNTDQEKRFIFEISKEPRIREKWLDSKNIGCDEDKNKFKWDEVLDNIVKRSNQDTDKTNEQE